jgi:Uma2 family endonuclease
MKTATPVVAGHIYVENIRWPTFLALLEDLGEHRGRLAYDEGRLEIVSPSMQHEHFKKLLGRLLEAFTVELGVEIKSVSSTTLMRDELKRAVEADECYYVQNEPAVRNKAEIDLARDPPPDLAIEVEVSRRIISRIPIYAALGIPEIWRFDGTTLRVCQLGTDGEYHKSERSTVFPELPLEELERFLSQRGEKGETELVRSFQQWVRSHFRLG